MAITVEQLNKESIILCRFEGAIDEQAVFDAYRDSLDITMTLPGPVYRVFNLSQVANPVADVITMIGNVVKDVTGAAVYPELAAVFVGTAPTPPTAATTMAPWFDNQNEALAFVRQQMGEGLFT